MLFSKRVLLLLLLICLPTLLFCQINITSPQNRAVYQRSQEGFSYISISGTYESQIDKIEARLTPVEPGQGDFVDWSVIKLLPLNGNFSSIMKVRQGWYILELRGSLNGAYIGGISRVDRVGVGEVFVITGQSNAQGMPNIAGIGATNDRVNCFGYATNTESGGDSYISLSPFSKLEANSRIAPRGMNGWCWGRLGDLLVNRLNVPVMFFNAAFEGTSSSTWAITANGGLAPNPYIGGNYQNKLPYQDLSDALHYFVNQLGVRAVLWCQGESDNFFINQKLVVDSEKYRSNLQTVINKSRSDSGKDISWVVSLTSGGSAIPCDICSTPIITDANVINGQQAVINQANNNVFQGPNTDLIQIVGRKDGVHFNGVGLEQLASAWNNSLNDNFFGGSKPQLPTTISDLSFNCGNNQVDVSLPDGFSNYQWSNNGTSFSNGVFSNQRVTTLAVGTDKKYYARYRDNVGNIIQVPYVSFVGSAVPSASATASSDVSFCDGNSVSLNANDASIYEWSNGSNSKSISVSTSGSFSVRTVNQFGCISAFSSPIVTTRNPLPPKPIITANGPTTFCIDTDVVLTSSNSQASNYKWSTGSNSQDLRINTSGTYTVTTISSQGCVSPVSDGIKIVVNPLPPTPTIVANGPTTFCADTSVVLTSSSQNAVNYLWNTGVMGKNITIKTQGNYTVRTIDQNNCFSLYSSTVNVKINPLPTTPAIITSKDSVFCDGDNTVLQMSLANGNSPTWLAYQNGKVTSYGIQNLTVTTSGVFRAFQTDGNNCKSIISPNIYTVAKPNPPKVDSIIRLSPYTVAVNAIKADQYIWQVNGVVNNSLTGNTIRFTEEANLSVLAKNVYTTLFYGDKTCFSPVSQEYNFKFFDDRGVSIYPNPSNGVFKIEARSNWNNTTFEVYDLLGRMIKKGTFSSLDISRTIDLRMLPEGEYMLRLNAESLLVAKRIIINR